MRRRLWRVAAVGGFIGLLWLTILGFQISNPAELPVTGSADVAIVLGAAVYGDKPSPVFEERIKHGITLYEAGRVEKLLFTGGVGTGAVTSEALVGSRYALARGVPPQAILAEPFSRTTKQNLLNARQVMQASGLNKSVIVSDPLHLKRALRMAHDLGMDARASPTPTTRYRSLQARAGFLLRELYFYHHYLVTGD